ncbi:hypothetical protein TSOC_007399 [Tetrabaena socialis]|uniref:Uncharacterized protein n=1 Tax=Tetrabaena socialis TaxID=47790 RepID=A0A2J8A151_9CHLO|nr:hypothetical protein TSOC_007399 [Tetrabaena socialis]|eukprot:PNH06250.1 hypothetical protein TSOC_007399 [Tetrabaena socialis]
MVALIRHAAFCTNPSHPIQTHTQQQIVRPRPVALPGRRALSSRPSRAGVWSWTSPQSPRCSAAAPDQPASQGAAAEEEFEGIPPEEDAEVPGNYLDALNPRSKLGKAISSAVDELTLLNNMEMDTLKQCDDLLKKLGIKTSIITSSAVPAAQQPEPEHDVEQQE